MTDRAELGRRRPPDFEHVVRYPFAAVAAETVAVAERTLTLPAWHWTHDQWRQGSCVGHGVVLERAITNSAQNKAAGVRLYGRRYDPLHVWDGAKARDPWPDTNPGDNNGTSVSAAYDFMREVGPRRCQIRFDNGPQPYNIKEPVAGDGVAANRWARSVDEVRTALAAGAPVAIGVDWYSSFDRPEKRTNGEWWLRSPVGNLGTVEGGHCVCLYAVSDRRQALKVKNSWGRSYPLVWLPYATLERLLEDYGEACIVTDR